MTRGLTYDAMSSELTISINTVRYHVKSLYGKLGVSSRADAIAYARKRGLL
jgi:LuxR family maltose regulon positive regulatory protein